MPKGGLWSSGKRRRQGSETLSFRQVVDNGDIASLRLAVGRRRVCLASASPRRRRILRACGISFSVCPSTVDEPPPHGPDWRAWVRTWSSFKASDVATRINRSALIIAADTIVVLGGHGLGKPRDGDDAVAMLKRLSGRSHSVITGITVTDRATMRGGSASEASVVTFRTLTDSEIRDYVRNGEPMDKAGAYAIQGQASAFIADVKGPIDNVVGLPVGALARLIRRVSA